ncbi:hypothetical protein CEXT_794481, partial [Caerostris extrusa]
SLLDESKEWCSSVTSSQSNGELGVVFLCLASLFFLRVDAQLSCPDGSQCQDGRQCCAASTPGRFECCEVWSHVMAEMEVPGRRHTVGVPSEFGRIRWPVCNRTTCRGTCCRNMCCEHRRAECCGEPHQCCGVGYKCCSNGRWCCAWKDTCSAAYGYCMSAACSTPYHIPWLLVCGLLVKFLRS